jgi:hypothetical protein
MLGIPRRYSHFIFGIIQSGLTSCIAAAVASLRLGEHRSMQPASGSIVPVRDKHRENGWPLN